MSNHLTQSFTGTDKQIPQLVDVETMARILGVPKSWIYGKTRETGPDSIPRLKCGKYIRFDPHAVMEWLKGR